MNWLPRFCATGYPAIFALIAITLASSLRVSHPARRDTPKQRASHRTCTRRSWAWVQLWRGARRPNVAIFRATKLAFFDEIGTLRLNAWAVAEQACGGLHLEVVLKELDNYSLSSDDSGPSSWRSRSARVDSSLSGGLA
jgi:hypothetical protein